VILQLFVTTVKEYKRFAEQLPLNVSTPAPRDEAVYIAVQTRLLLLRKYITEKVTFPLKVVPFKS
jgi:hypothetical protein